MYSHPSGKLSGCSWEEDFVLCSNVDAFLVNGN